MENTKLYVGNIPFATTAQDLEGLLGQAGAVSVVEIVFDKFTGRSRGFAFVTMGSAEEAQKAVDQFNNYDLGGRKLAVNIARPREERAPREGGFGGGGGGRGGFGGGRGGPRRFGGGGGGFRGGRGGDRGGFRERE
ncbi:MAG: RNA-binding protein [Opitutae bacterium]|nr:RNA-binding protein [Opitutae bacterium]